MNVKVILPNILILLYTVLAQTNIPISRLKGNIFKNLTGTTQFEDNIVTSSLDNSPLIRMFYRGAREFYSRFIAPGTGQRHDSERFQPKFSAAKRFPCSTDEFRSRRTPKSVHHLKPGG